MKTMKQSIPSYYLCNCDPHDIYCRFYEKACEKCGTKVSTLAHFWKWNTIAIYSSETKVPRTALTLVNGGPNAS